MDKTEPKNNKVYLVLLVLFIIVFVGGILFLNSKKEKTTPAMSDTGVNAQLPKESRVSLTKDGFVPKEVSIGVGGAVRWTNESGDKATVNSNDHPTHQLHKEMNLGTFEKGSTLVNIFDKPGTYGYHDHFHPERTGTVIVK